MISTLIFIIIINLFLIIYIGYATYYLIKALTIALRYSAARLQFGPDNSNVEYPVLEYQAQVNLFCKRYYNYKY